MPTWLKPTYIAIAVLIVLLGMQTWRLNSAQLEVAHVQTAQAQLVADVATARADGVAEGARQQQAAQTAKDAAAAAIIAGLQADKVELQKHYDATYNMLKDFAGQEKWSCLKEPLPESVLNEFRR